MKFLLVLFLCFVGCVQLPQAPPSKREGDVLVVVTPHVSWSDASVDALEGGTP